MRRGRQRFNSRSIANQGQLGSGVAAHLYNLAQWATPSRVREGALPLCDGIVRDFRCAPRSGRHRQLPALRVSLHRPLGHCVPRHPTSSGSVRAGAEASLFADTELSHNPPNKDLHGCLSVMLSSRAMTPFDLPCLRRTRTSFSRGVRSLTSWIDGTDGSACQPQKIFDIHTEHLGERGQRPCRAGFLASLDLG